MFKAKKHLMCWYKWVQLAAARSKDGSADASYKGRITVYKHLEDLPDTS